jgi:hypothetical protein
VCIPAPTARRALAEASTRWPQRNRASDGICPSAEHSLQNPTSDHERGMAFDLTHDPEHGCDAHHWAEQLMLRRDWRVKYVISNRRIWNPSISANWREYGGSNPHIKHMHVSLVDAARDDTATWWEPPANPRPVSLAPPHPQEDDMPAPTQVVDACRAPNGGIWLLQFNGGVRVNGNPFVDAPYHGSVLDSAHPAFPFPGAAAIIPTDEGGYIIYGIDGWPHGFPRP